MFTKLILFVLGIVVASCNANCLTGSTVCHEAATCRNMSGTPTCVCDKWFIGDGINYCYGVCNSTCSIRNEGLCRSTSLGYTCLANCYKKSQDCASGLHNAPKNVKVAWKSSTAVIFQWDFSKNAYLYKAELKSLNSFASVQRTTSYIPVVGFFGLVPNSAYQFVVSIDSVNEKARLDVTTDSTTNDAEDICDNPNGCGSDVDECERSTHRCHSKATCSNTNNGYRCTCKHNYIGNGTLCVGVCAQPCRTGTICRPDEFGSSCFCGNSECRVPQTPRSVSLVFQTETTLGFDWQASDHTASYSVILNRANSSRQYHRTYHTTVSHAAFSGLLPGTVYTFYVTAYNLKGASGNSPASTFPTVISSGPDVKVTNTKSDQVTISFPAVPYSTSYEVEYYKERNETLRKTGNTTSYVIQNLSTGSYYHVIVYVNYQAGRSKGSSPVKFFVGPLCNKKKDVCHLNEVCTSDDQCQCKDGYTRYPKNGGNSLRNGTMCKKTYAIPFRQNLLPGVTSKQLIEDRLRQDLDSSQIGSIQIGNIVNNSVTFTVFTQNPNITLKKLKLGDFFRGSPMSIEKICLARNISGYTFNETKLGNIQRSIETCSNGEPAANITCVFNETLSSDAVFFNSYFSLNTLNRINCNDFTTQVTTAPVLTNFKYNATSVSNKSEVVYDISIPVEAIQQAISQLNVSNIVPSITVHQGHQEIDKKFPSPFNLSYVLSIDIGENTTIENLTSPVVIINFWENSTYGEVKPVTSLLNSVVKQRCVYWDEEALEWSGRGCCLENNVSPPTCKCNHLSSFAVLVSTVEVPANFALDVVSDIACALSILGLAATFLILILNKEARLKVPNIIQLHFCFALFVTYIVFVFGVSQVDNFALCTMITAVLHYFFLVSWIWIGIYSNRLYVALSQVFKQTGKNFVRKCCVFAYGLPFVVVGINVAITVGHYDSNLKDEDLCIPVDSITKSSHYKAQNMCWLNSYSLYFGFLSIVGIILVNNMIVLVLVMGKLFKRQNIRSTRAKRSRFSDLISALSLSFTLGLTWLFGFLMLVSTDVTYNTVLMWFFAIFTASQGFAIWYVTCVRRKDIRDFWWHPIKNFFIRIGIKLNCFSTATTARMRNKSFRSEFNSNNISFFTNRKTSSSTTVGF